MSPRALLSCGRMHEYGLGKEQDIATFDSILFYSTRFRIYSSLSSRKEGRKEGN